MADGAALSVLSATSIEKGQLMDNPWTRRQFMRVGAGTLAAGAAAKATLLEPTTLWAAATQTAPSDTIRFASIGTGVRGCELLKASLRVPGVDRVL